MLTALVNGQILTDAGLVLGKAVVLDGERIAAVLDARDAPAHVRRRDLQGGVLAPGFIDSQVNGGGGVMFGDQPSVEAIRAIGAAHRHFGVTGFLPTLISSDLGTIRRAIEAVRRALEAGEPGLLGLHIEGPFLSAERKGIHDASRFRTIDQEALALLTSLGAGRTLVTLAPETTSPAMIRQLADAGVIVSAGHTNASYATVRAALDQGLRGFTHLFNAMSQLGAREPGTVGAALDDPDSWCAVIVDGKHVDPVVLRLALRAKRRDRFILVTDAMPCVGSDETAFELDGRLITVKDGVCVDAKGTLAGSNLDMATAVRNGVRMLGLDTADALRMASLHPAAFLRLGDGYGRIAAGARADLVLLDEGLQAVDTWIGGKAASEDG